MYINPRIIALYDEYTHAPRLETGTMEFGGMRCYVARPRDAAAKMPAVIVIHENRGLNPHIEDVTRHAARRGPRARWIARLDRAQTIANLLALVADLARAIHVYPGTEHAFHNDTAGARYNKQAAELAWSRTMAFLKDALR